MYKHKMTDKNLINKAHNFLQENRTNDAIQIYKELLIKYPSDCDLMRYLALSYVQNGEIEKAIVTFNSALSFKDDSIIHMNLANVYKSNGNIEKAIAHYQKAIEITPKYAKAQNNLASLYASIGDYPNALRSYRDALHSDPSFILAHLNLGILLFKNQELLAAETQFKNVLSIDDANISAQFYLGLLNINRDDLDAAQKFFSSILTKDAGHVESLVNLGVISLKQGKDQIAVDYFTKALAFDNSNLEARNNLAAIFIHNDRYENALKYYVSLLAEDPNNIEYLYNTGVAKMGLGHIHEATNLFLNVLSIENQHFGAISNLAAIKMRISDRAAACDLLKRALEIKPDDATTKFMLSAISQKDKNITHCPTYATDLFNHYAMYYEKHMQDTLEYSLPNEIWKILHELNIPKVSKALDLGCGTGLLGEIIKPFCQKLIGVDIATKMLSVAKNKEIYDELIEDEALTFLLKYQNKYDLIIAADVLPYFSALDDLFKAIKDSINENGLFIYSIEISEDASWKLQESIRYCHNPEYINTLIEIYNGEPLLSKKITARKQSGQNLKEIIYAIKFLV